PVAAALFVVYPYQTRSATAPKYIPGGWDFIIVGLILWVAGLVLDTILAFQDPHAYAHLNPGSLFLTAAYPAFFSGCWRLVPRQRQYIGNLGAILDLLVTCLALTTLMGMILVNPLLSQVPSTPAGIFWEMIFPVLDIALFFALLYLSLTNPRGDLQILFAGFLLGCLALLWSDIAATYLHMKFSPYPDWSTGVGWVAGSTLIFLGILLREKRGESVGQNHTVSTLAIRVSQLLPIAATVVFVWYLLLDWRLRNDFFVPGGIIAGLCVFVIILRQGVIAGEAELQQFAMLVNSVAEPAFILDQHGKFKLANPALSQCCLLGKEDELLNQDFHQFFEIEVVEPGWLRQALKNGWTGEIALRQKSGDSIPVHLTLTPFQREGSRQLFLAGTAHDLSELKRQQADLLQAYEQVAAAHKQLEGLNESLEQKVAEKTRSLSEAYARLEQQNLTLQQLDEVKSDFVSMVSHELRAPLTNISGGIELVLSNPHPFPRQARQSLSLVQAEITRLNHFVKTILDISAIDAGRLPFDPAPISLSEMLEKFRYQIGGYPNAERIEWQIHEPLPIVLADESALASIFFHLIDNALKYAPEGRIVVIVLPGEDCVRASIVDEGPGIPAEALPLLFDKFYRLHSGDAQTIYGHGLGLYMVRRLLHAMNGDIAAANRPQGGASFTFWLPTPKGQEIDEP
ncbi:MAG TPA: ATP-binding protein, partial [Anaerolineaceae bacterium]|nr:ATP-binding protein [Anaerolineaceae bacterium]